MSSHPTDWAIIEGVVSRVQQTSEGKDYDLATQALNAICRLRQMPDKAQATKFEPGAPERVMLFIGNAEDGGHALAKHLDFAASQNLNPQTYVRLDLAQKAIDQIAYSLRPHALIVMVDPENNYSVGQP